MVDGRLDAFVFSVVPSAFAPNFVIGASSDDASAIHADPRKGAATNNDIKRRRSDEGTQIFSARQIQTLQ
jgi:hypothetical protein